MQYVWGFITTMFGFAALIVWPGVRQMPDAPLRDHCRKRRATLYTRVGYLCHECFAGNPH